MSNSKRKAHCNKVKHSTLLSAQIALKRTHANASKRGAPIMTCLAAYRCPYCDGYHVGRSKLKGINWDVVRAEDVRIEKLRRASACA